MLYYYQIPYKHILIITWLYFIEILLTLQHDKTLLICLG